jgi:hypothetical protein
MGACIGLSAYKEGSDSASKLITVHNSFEDSGRHRGPLKSIGSQNGHELTPLSIPGPNVRGAEAEG